MHRFGSCLNRHLHLLFCMFYGVFVERENQAPRFSSAPALHKDEPCELVETIGGRGEVAVQTRGRSGRSGLGLERDPCVHLR